MRKVFFLILSFHFPIAVAQFVADFEEGCIDGWVESVPGRWAADSMNRIFGRYSLHHIFDNSEAGMDAISHSLPSFVPDSGEMVFLCRIRHGYAPSGSNRWGWFLYADADASIMVSGKQINGYMAGINFTGNDDCLHLYKVRNGACIAIYNTGFNWEALIGTSKAPLIKITRSSSGFWDISIDTTDGTGNSISLGGIPDNEFLSVLHTGFCFAYTATKDRLFWADDLQISGRIIMDTIPPFVTGYSINSSRSVRFKFSENLLNGENIRAFYAYQGRLIRAVAESGESSQEIVLQFDEDFPDGDSLQIKLEGVSDRYGNQMNPAEIPILYHHFRRFDILITEIMADPSPPVELPEYEYVELYNASPFEADLTGWNLEAGSHKFSLNRTIKPHRYMLLVHKAATGLYGDSVQVVPVFTTDAVLTNSGAKIVLRNQAGEWVDAVEYTDRWYQSNEKKDGGFSLEMIDPKNPCAANTNWKASESAYGGTPGYRNSVSASNPDQEAPLPVYAVVADSQRVDLYFSEPVDSNAASAVMHYRIFGAPGFPYKVIQSKPKSAEVNLFFAQPFKTGQIYELRVSRNICDCAGNHTMNDRSVRFAIPSVPDPEDLVINEIMYHSDDSLTEFVEIYNNSSKPIDLAKLWLAIYASGSDELQTRKVLSAIPRIIFPEDYLAICRDCRKLTERYIFPFPWSCLEMPEMPALNDGGGTMAILTTGMEFIDVASWADEMQFPLLHNPKGVSLERIHPSAPSDDPSNWHSASSLAGYATPGRKNSQYIEPEESGGKVHVVPEVFSPDNDGINDFLEIGFSDEDPGWITDIRIFEMSGRPVRYLVSSKTTGTFSRIIWDGTSDNGNLCYNGIYIILIRRWNLHGRKEEFKKTCVLYVPGKR